MKAQEYEDQWEFRIKFASIADNGYLIGDSHEEYDTLFQDLPDEWSANYEELVKTRQEGQRRSWLLRHNSEEIAAVEHETGVEILIAFGVEFTAAAIIGFTVWAWTKWRASRAGEIVSGQKVEPSLVLESVEERFPDGRSRITRRVEIRGPLNETEVDSAIRKWGGRSGPNK